MSNIAIPIDLSEEQQEAVDYLLGFPEDVQTLGGYAGTGKTTVVKALHEEQPEFAVCAFTGKAANVLRQKGVPATTIHSRIYHPEEVEYRDAKGKWQTKVTYILKMPDKLECQGFIVDEASMVGRQLYDDLCSFDLPIIFVGDHGQLEPVEGRGFNLMADPDVTLEVIHRNAGNIARFAEWVRKGNPAAGWRVPGDDGGGSVLSPTLNQGKPFGEEGERDKVFCAYNRPGVSANRQYRDGCGYQPGAPVVGDRVMCLQNDHKIG